MVLWVAFSTEKGVKVARNRVKKGSKKGKKGAFLR